MRRYSYSWTTVMLPQNGSPPRRATGILPLPVAHFFDEPPECGVPHKVYPRFLRYLFKTLFVRHFLFGAVQGSEVEGRLFPAIQVERGKKLGVTLRAFFMVFSAICSHLPSNYGLP